MFAIPIGIAAPVVFGLARDSGQSMFAPALAIIALAMGLGGLVVYLARRVLEPAEQLERTRVILEDAYDRARAESLRDALTGLGNHRGFQEEYERQWLIARRHGTPLALAMIDLDDFKRVNDQGGHSNGDRCLTAFSRTLIGQLRRTDRAFRVGGDEFAILLPQSDMDGAYMTIRRLLAASLEASTGYEIKPSISFTAGISALPGPAVDRETMYRQADAALFWGKRHGRTAVVTYDAERHDEASARPPAELSAAIGQIAATGALRAVFQPIFDMRSGAVHGFEGLIRPLPGTGFDNPSELFTAAEATGRTVELDLACLATVLSSFATLRLPGTLTINLSPRTLESDEFSVPALLHMLRRHRVEPSNVVLELTEREVVEDLERLRRAVEACRAAGMRVAADDVGAGNSGLRLLSQVMFDIVKIDLSLVQGGAVRETSLEVVRTLRDLADRWGALVIAEGIETPAQLQLVRSLGIAAGQGYLLGRPADTPTSDAVDLDALVRGSGDWLVEQLRALPA
jgi:diguanylate cyclase (GGDEF)-like protein